MKLALVTTLLFTSLSFSANKFGAFINNNQLYITVLGDCNTASAALVVNPICRKDRRTDNFVQNCQTELVVATTRMFCPDQEVIPKVFTFDLAKEMVATEATKLEIKYNSETVKLKISK